MATCTDNELDTEVPETDTVDLGQLLDEYSEFPSPLQSSYVKRMTEEEFINSGATETEKALRELILHLESNPDQYVKLMRKRKLDELESKSVVSYITSKVKCKLLGDKRYEESLVSERECRERLEELTDGMMVVHHYAQEAKRCSQRLADKFAHNNIGDLSHSVQENARRSQREGGPRHKIIGSSVDPRDLSFHLNTGTLKRPSLRSVDNIMSGTYQATAVPLPPPPPPPPAINGLLGGKLILPKKSSSCLISSTPLPGKSKVTSILKKSGSVTSLADIQQELRSADPLKRLRTTNVTRSPGGTPVLNPSKNVGDVSSASLNWNSPLNISEPLGVAFMRILQHKFKDVRSPSPSPSSPSNSFNSTGAFSP